MDSNYTIEEIKVWEDNPVTQEVFRRMKEKSETLNVEIVNDLLKGFQGGDHSAKMKAAEIKTLQDWLTVGDDLMTDLTEEIELAKTEKETNNAV